METSNRTGSYTKPLLLNYVKQLEEGKAWRLFGSANGTRMRSRQRATGVGNLSGPELNPDCILAQVCV